MELSVWIILECDVNITNCLTRFVLSILANMCHVSICLIVYVDEWCVTEFIYSYKHHETFTKSYKIRANKLSIHDTMIYGLIDASWSRGYLCIELYCWTLFSISDKNLYRTRMLQSSASIEHFTYNTCLITFV